MVWKIDNPQCNESKKIVWEVAPYLAGRGLDLGAGDFKVIPHAISVDDMSHEVFGFVQRPDVMADITDLSVFASQSMDYVYSSHALEHIVDYKAALKEWWRVVKPGGYLILYLPHKEFYPNIGQSGSNPDHKHDFLPQDVVDAVPDGYDLVERQDRSEGEEYSFLLVFRKLNGTKRNQYSHSAPRPDKTACVVRYGAYGDLMQASSVWAGLKKQGYHVTVFTSNPQAEVITHDPNIDKIVLFDRDQVPNPDLVNFWSWQAKKFDKFVNLSESVEGTLLAMPGRSLSLFPPKARHSLLNKNYLEFQHELAGVPHEPSITFFPTYEERRWAEKQRKKLPPGPVILWTLAGSSVHKTWPYLDNVLATLLLEYPTASVALAGNLACQMLEAGWENEPRIVKTCGKWSIRETLAFLEQCDLVIGPETGVLNAASGMKIPKIVFLSHSTQENLTRDWVNTTSLYARETHCPGRGANAAPACHILHYNWDNCARDVQTGCAKCQAEISIPEVVYAIKEALK